MKLKLILVCTFFCSVVICQSCTENCQNCTNTSACVTCKTGYFLASKTECKPCPQQCKVCNIGAGGLPACSQCNSGFQLSSTKQCITCIPGCSKCTESPQKCTQCSTGFTLINTTLVSKINNTNVTSYGVACSENKDNCTQIKNCKSCSGDTNSQICDTCAQRYYNFRRGCERCRTPCLSCKLDLNQLWDFQVLPFWNATLIALKQKVNAVPIKRRLLTQDKPFVEVYKNWTIIDWNSSSWTSQQFKNFTAMNLSDVKGWTQAYFFFKAAQTQLGPKDTLVNLISYCLPILEEIKNLTYESQDQWKHLARYLSKYSIRKWNAPNLNDKITELASAKTVCVSCLTGYSLNVTTGACVKCPQNCISCNTLGTCMTCRSGFMVSGKNCLRCHPLCAECSKTIATCTSCNPPLLPVNGTCSKCHPSCKTCSIAQDARGCLTCSSQYSLYPHQSACFKCYDPVCKQCDPFNKTKCISCQDGSALVNDKCVPCPSGCKSCSTFNNNVVCYQCKPAYVLFNKTCSRCISGCDRCSKTNSSICLVCQDQRYFDPQTKTCKQCTEGCARCSNSTECSQTKEGVIVWQGKPVKCAPGCSKCNYDKPSVCVSCSARYYLDGSTCVRCKDGCLQCTKTGCVACMNNNYAIQVNGTCSPCSSKCASCSATNVTQCLTCKRGWVLNNLGTCTHSTGLCEQGCINCNIAATQKCLQCATGYALRENGTCTKCLKTCNGKCNPRNITQCLSCMDGFTLSQNGCKVCPLGCSLCIDNVCTKCIQGYKLDLVSSTCKISCPFPYLTCNSSAAITCESGYINQLGKCMANVTCNPECGNCPIGTYQTSTLQCIRCASDCAICTGGVCSSCYQGYFLNNKTQCQACVAPCLTCYDNVTCKACSSGFIKQVIATGAFESDIVYGDKCVTCDDNCLTCAILRDRCTSCKTGWRLKGQRCIKLYAVKYRIRIDTDYKTFLQNGTSDSVLNAIAKKAGVEWTRTGINNLTQGSTILQGSIQVENTTEAVTVISSLGTGAYNDTLLDNNILEYSMETTYLDGVMPNSSVAITYTPSSTTATTVDISGITASTSISTPPTSTTSSTSSTSTSTSTTIPFILPTTSSTSTLASTVTSSMQAIGVAVISALNSSVNSSLNSTSSNSTIDQNNTTSNTTSNSTKNISANTSVNASAATDATPTSTSTENNATGLYGYFQQMYSRLGKKLSIFIFVVVSLSFIVSIVLIIVCCLCKRNSSPQHDPLPLANTQRVGETICNTKHTLQTPDEQPQPTLTHNQSQPEPQIQICPPLPPSLTQSKLSQSRSNSLTSSQKRVQFKDTTNQTLTTDKTNNAHQQTPTQEQTQANPQTQESPQIKQQSPSPSPSPSPQPQIQVSAQAQAQGEVQQQQKDNDSNSDGGHGENGQHQSPQLQEQQKSPEPEQQSDQDIQDDHNSDNSNDEKVVPEDY